jgi:peptide deformylase
MSDVLTIDTSEAITKIKEEKPQILMVYSDKHSMLNEVMPEYTDPLPNKEMYELIRSMKETMKIYGGIGLSANQCAIRKRVFVMGTDQFQIACINPKVLEVSLEKEKQTEGCLSFPAMFMKVERPKSVFAEYTNENGEVQQEWFHGLTARCFLHETDHMNGIKYTKYVGPMSIHMAQKKQQKKIKNIKRKMKNVI